MTFYSVAVVALLCLVGLEFYILCMVLGMVDKLREKEREAEKQIKRLTAENMGYAQRAVVAERERDMARDVTTKYERFK